MKKILPILFVMLIWQVVFAQTEAYKFTEYGDNGGGCENYFRYSAFTDEIAKNDENKGLVVIYTGESKGRFGNVLAYAKGAIRGVEGWLKFPPDKISIVILEGGSFFAQEFWILPKDAKPPYKESYKFDWSRLDDKYHFSETCLQCEPDYPWWTSFQAGFKEYATILKEYPHYKGQIIVNDYWELAVVKRRLTKDEKLPRNRYSIQIRKKSKDEEWASSVDLYLIPNLK